LLAQHANPTTSPAWFCKSSNYQVAPPNSFPA
jgi:hypothetical protein